MKTSLVKRLGILLAALIVLGGGMLALNGTFATQVDYTGEKTVLGNGQEFNVSLEYFKDGEYVSLFDVAQPFSDSSKWCPGRSEIVYLRLSNKEQFPVSCSLTLNVKENGFDEQLQYAILPGNLLADGAVHPASWSEFVQATEKNAAVLTQGKHQLIEEKTLLNPGEPNDQYLALCIHMNEGADSSYQNKKLSMNFSLLLDANYEPGSEPTK